MSLPDVKRRPMTPARKRRIHTRCGGRCGICDAPLPVDGPAVVYDHEPPLEIRGEDLDVDVRPICAEPCNRIKTAKDQARIAKVRRLHDAHTGQEKPKRGRQLQGRGFDKTKTRGFDRKVRPRKIREPKL